MDEYVVGFCFADDLESVWLIRKKRPSWQAGRLNGIGGHIEDGESPAEAMNREFTEEAGLPLDEWEYFGSLEDKRKWKVYLFRTVLSRSHSLYPYTKTDEEVVRVYIKNLPSRLQMIPNLSWLIPMALEAPHGMQYEIKETDKSV